MLQLSHPEIFNIPLAEKVLEHVVSRPEDHDQGHTYHSCAQTGCIMGWGALFTAQEIGMSGATGTMVFAHVGPQTFDTTEDEFVSIYGEASNEIAIEKLKDYIEQARAAQTVQEDWTLQVTDDPIKELTLV